MSSEETTLERIFGGEDWKMVLGLLVAIYLTYMILGVVLGYGMRGQINSLGSLTFYIAVFAMLALALNLHWGYTGLFNIGVVAFMGIGIYTMGVLVKPPLSADATASVGGFGLPVWVGVIGGVLMATIFGFIVALPALRLRADYLAIVTIAFSEIMRFVFLSGDLEAIPVGGDNAVGLGGGSGLILNFVGPLEWLMRTLFLWDPYLGFVQFVGETLNVQNPQAVVDQMVYSAVLLLGVAGFYWILKRTGESPFGRVLKAIREDEDVARALGKNTDRFKIKSFMLGCGLMGLAGIFWLYYQGAVTPSNFRPRITFFVWIALIIGGAGSNTGSVMGGAIFAAVLYQGPLYIKNVVETVIDPTSYPPSFGSAMAQVGQGDPVAFFLYTIGSVRELQLVIMGLVLIWLMHNRPEGMLGHRNETAAAIDLSRPTSRGGGSPAGGEGDE